MPQLTEPLIEQIMVMMEQGYPSNEIMAKLQEQGYSAPEIKDALTQAQTKVSVESPEVQFPPSPPTPEMQPSLLNKAPQQPYTFTRVTEPAPPSNRELDERIEEIAESIIDEKWQKVIEDIGDVSAWKERLKMEITAMKQEILRVENRMEALQQSILGRIREYDRQIGEVGTDVKAVEKLLQNILSPLTENVKELKRITEKLKR